MTKEEAIARLKANRDAMYFPETIEALDMAIEALSNIETDPETETELCDTCKYYETSHEEYPCSDCTFGNSYYVPVEAEDTQTEERARLVAKETELAHVEAKLENAEKKLDSTIKALSAVTAQGEWIKHEGKWVDFDFYPTKYECNQCHYCVDEGYDSIFCPNCGARMKGAEDE